MSNLHDDQMLPYARNLAESAYPWISTIDRLMKDAGVKRTAGKTLYVTSDYSGSHKESKYDVISILLVDLDQAQDWPARRARIRELFLPDGRRMSYKNLNDHLRQKALAPFLCAAGQMPGLLVSVAISKRIRHLVTTPRSMAVWKSLRSSAARWSSAEFERMARIAFFASLFTSRMMSPNQDVIWISDEDQILANSPRQQDVAHMAGSFADLLYGVPAGRLHLGTTNIYPGDRGEEDFAAIPDLAAGAIADVFSECSSRAGWPNLEELPASTKPKSDFIVDWMIYAPKVLKNLVFLFEQHPSGGILVGRIQFTTRRP